MDQHADLPTISEILHTFYSYPLQLKMSHMF